MSDQKLDTQIRKEQIAEAALDLVASQGIGALSVAAVARRVGLVPSGIYRHFKSKDDVLDAVLDLLESRLSSNVRAACEETSNPIERMKGVLVRHVRIIRQGRAIPRIIFSDEVHRGHPNRKARVQKILAGYLAHVTQFARDGQAQGLVRSELDPQTVSLMFMGMIVPAGILWHLTDGGFNMTQHVGKAWEMFLRAIETRPKK